MASSYPPEVARCRVRDGLPSGDEEAGYTVTFKEVLAGWRSCNRILPGQVNEAIGGLINNGYLLYLGG